MKTLIFPLSWEQTRLQQKQNYWGKSKKNQKTHNCLQTWIYTLLLLYLLCWSSMSLSLTRTFNSFRSCKNSLSRSTSMSSIMSSNRQRGAISVKKQTKKNSLEVWPINFVPSWHPSCLLLLFSRQKLAKCWLNDKQCLVFHWHEQHGFYF